MSYSTWCIIASPMFAVPSTFLTKSGFFNFSILNSFFLTKAVSMNKSVTPLSNNIFTAIPLWFSSFSSPTFIHTSHSDYSIYCTSLTLLVLLEKFNLLPNFSGHNTLYRLLEASQELTILHFLLPTPTAFLLLFPYVFSNNFWPYGPISHIHDTFYLLLFPCLYPLHLGLSLDLFGFLLYWMCFLLYILPLCSVLLLSMLYVLLFLHIILLAMHFLLSVLYSSPTLSLLPCSASGSYLILLLSLATLQW